MSIKNRPHTRAAGEPADFAKQQLLLGVDRDAVLFHTLGISTAGLERAGFAVGRHYVAAGANNLAASPQFISKGIR